jgi:membrane dipeptidase
MNQAAQAVHDDALIVDCRDPSFLVYRQTREEKPDYWQTVSDGGLTAIMVDVPWTDDGYRDASLNFAMWHDRIGEHPEATLVRTVDDIRRAKADGTVGFILSSQTPTIIEDDVRLLRALYEQGLRVMQMSYQKRNLLADGCGERADGGLTNFGAQAIHEMNRLGIAIDLSHASDRTMSETIAESEKPVFFSHSNSRSRVDNPRNVPDDVLKELVRRGGICGVSAYSAFLKEGGGSSGTDLTDYVAMIDHMADLIGIDNLCMGFDVGEFRTHQEVAIIGSGATKTPHDPSTRYVKELMTRRNLPRLTEALLDRGYDAESTHKFLGGNVIRFLTEVWDPAPEQA